MNIFNKVALQGLLKNRTRTLVTIVGVVLSAALITAVTTFGVSLLSYLTKGAVAKYGDWHAVFDNVDAAFVKEQADSDAAESAAVLENIGYARLNGNKEGAKPYLFLLGYNEEAFAKLPVTLFSGRLPENDGEVLVSGKVATDAGVKLAPGDELTVTVGARLRDGKVLGQSDPFDPQAETFAPREEKTYKVAGVCQRPSLEADAAPGYTLITKADNEADASGYTLLVTLKDPYQLRAYLAKAAGDRPYRLNDNVLRFMGLSDSSLFNGLLYALGGIVIAIIMIGSIFLIYNSFTISLCERMRQFGVLMSVGATARQLRNSVLFEGLCIGAVGIPLGIAVGMGCIQLVMGVVAKTFASILYVGIPLTMTVSLPALLAAGAISLVTILLSAYVPARKAVRTPVMECIRQTNEIKVEAKAVKASGFARRVYGLNGTLALKNFKRNRKRYRSIVLSLVLSVTLFISASAFVKDMKALSGQETEFTTYDIAVTAKDMDDREMLMLFDALKNADGVYESSYQAIQTYHCRVAARELSDGFRKSQGLLSSEDEAELTVDLQFIEDEAYLAFLREANLPAEAYAGANARLISVAKTVDGAGTLREPSEYSDLFLSDTARLSLLPCTGGAGQARELSVTFVNVVPPDSLPVLEGYTAKPYMFCVLAPYSLKAQYPGPEATKGMTFRSETPTRTAAEMEERLQAMGAAGSAALYNISGLMAENHNYVFIVDVFASTFIAMITLIAIANVFNTISTNIKLRRRELAMLRSVGMSERDFQQMMNFECVFYGMRALLFGLPIAALASWGVHKVMVTEDVAYTIPWTSMGVSVVGVLAIVFVTMLYATRKIRNENIIDALRDDMT